MIPLPPADAALPSLGAALSGSVVAELMQRHLPDCASGVLRVESCRPSYVRYKPGTSCMVQYELELRDVQAGSLVRTLAHIRLFPADRAQHIWTSGSLARLVERAARRHPGLPRSHAAYLPELPAVAQVYPVDVELRGLVRAASRSKMRKVLGGALLGAGAPRLLKCEVDLIRYKPARKALFRYRLKDAPIGFVYGKLHADERGLARFRIGQALAAAGVPTPAALGYVPDLRMLIHAEAAGTRLADCRGHADFGHWLEAVAQTLSDLHAVPLPDLPGPWRANESDLVVKAGQSVAGVVPTLAAEVERIVTGLVSQLESVKSEPTTVHGDFYDDQVLVSDSGVVLLDFDSTRLGHPLLDVGNFLAHLSARLDASRADETRAVFLDTYLAQRPERRQHVALFEAAALLKLAIGPFRRLESDWPAAIERLVLLAAKRLEGGGGAGAPFGDSGPAAASVRSDDAA